MSESAHSPVLRGLYAITDNRLIGGERLIPAVTEAIEGGARIIQYRDKTNDQVRRLKEATALLKLCQSVDIPLIINDDIELAANIGADGVHLGSEDRSLSEARSRLGPTAIIGLSCYNDLERANNPEADYLAFGRFFPSSTKPDTRPADISILTAASSTLNKPIAAIGGITGQNGKELHDAGADMLAVVAGVFGEKDIRAAARRLAVLYQ